MKLHRVTKFGFLMFLLLGIFLTINFYNLIKTGNNDESLFYPCIITLFLGVINLKNT